METLKGGLDGNFSLSDTSRTRLKVSINLAWIEFYWSLDTQSANDNICNLVCLSDGKATVSKLE